MRRKKEREHERTCCFRSRPFGSSLTARYGASRMVQFTCWRCLEVIFVLSLLPCVLRVTVSNRNLSDTSAGGNWNRRTQGAGDCASGIQSGEVCCAASCGTCGGSGCSGQPGGSSQCCKTTIRDSGVACATPSDTGCIVPSVSPQCKACNCNGWDGTRYYNCSAITVSAPCTNYCAQCEADGVTPMPGLAEQHGIECEKYAYHALLSALTNNSDALCADLCNVSGYPRQAV